MRDYIILNGVNSNTITGLLISKLPPITKPKQRTTVEEIDGRDGDIVTKLGYSAYNKEFEIGLYGDFDIDDVIAYFNSEGTVVFSNEDDKYYNYQILEQIDYDKLIRFKKATVKMHVQPFKYPLEETPVEITIQTVNNEAEEMDLDNTKEAPMTIALKGNTSQEGTPTPSSPIAVNVVSGNNSIDVCGKNLISTNINDLEQGTISGRNGTNDFSNNRVRNNRFFNFDYDEIQPNHVWLVPTGYKIAIRVYDQNKNFVGTLTYSGFLGDLPSAYVGLGIKYIKIVYAKNDDSDITPNDIANLEFMISKGNDTTYEPYIGKSYPINLGTMELCKIGDYQDYIYKDNGKWYLHKEIGKVVLDGSHSGLRAPSQTSDNYRMAVDIGTNIISGDANLTAPIYSDKFIGINRNQSYAEVQGIAPTDPAFNYKSLIIYCDATKNMTYAEFQTWLSTNNVLVYYVLATPTTTEITDTTLISQLNALAGAESYSGQTNISQTNDDKPFILNATALQQGSGEATVNNEGNIYSKPTLDIEGSGTVGIYLDGNQMFSVDLSNATECIIDTAQLEAYNPSTDALMNRQVTGDYSNFKLNAGESQVSTTGEITKVTISNYTRWL